MNARDNNPQGNVGVYDPEHAGRFTVGDTGQNRVKAVSHEMSDRARKQKPQVPPDDDATDEHTPLPD